MGEGLDRFTKSAGEPFWVPADREQVNDTLAPIFVPADGAPSSETTLMAMPLFLSQVLPTGMIGLMAAAMLAAFMSTHDSYFLCWSSVLTQDVVGPMSGERISTRTRLVLTRVLIVVIGLFLLVWSLWYPLKQDMWDYMAVTGAIYFTGAFALLVCGIYWKRASVVGAYASLACGFGALLGLGPCQQMLGLAAYGDSLTADRVGLTTVAASVVVMIVGSLLFPTRPSPANGDTKAVNA